MTTSTTPSAPALTGLADFFTRWHSIHSNASTTPSVAVSPGFAARLAEFFIAWAERPDALSAKPAMPEPLAIQLQRFSGAWRRLERALEPQRSARVIDWAAQALELTRFLQHLRPALQAQAEQRRLGSSINVWRASGLGSDELRNSKVLACQRHGNFRPVRPLPGDRRGQGPWAPLGRDLPHPSWSTALAIQRDLEDAMRLLKGELSENVFAAIDKVIQTWAESMEWDGVFDLLEDETYFGPKQWRISAEESDDWIAYFAINATDTDDEEWLTALLAARQERIGFEFAIDYRVFDITKAVWRNFARTRNQEYAEIGKAGFHFDPGKGTWFLPWKLDATLLAKSYSVDAIEDSLGPLNEALGRIESLYPTFAKLVESAQQQFGANHDA